MSWVTRMKLSASPRPRKRELPYRPFSFPIVSARRLPTPEVLDTRLTEALEMRRSNRTFRRPLNDRHLSFLLWHICRKISSEREASGFVWEHRAVPSAGGRHPIHSVIVQPMGQRHAVSLYVPEDHKLAALHIPDPPVRQLLTVCNQIMDVRRATIIWFVAEIRRTDSKYVNAESLIWRDAGAILAYLNLMACVAKMTFCALGPTGEPFVSQMLQSSEMISGVGGCAVGFDR